MHRPHYSSSLHADQTFVVHSKQVLLGYVSGIVPLELDFPVSRSVCDISRCQTICRRQTFDRFYCCKSTSLKPRDARMPHSVCCLRFNWFFFLPEREMGTTRDRRSLQHRPPAINVETVGARDLLSSSLSPVSYLRCLSLRGRTSLSREWKSNRYGVGGWLRGRWGALTQTNRPADSKYRMKPDFLRLANRATSSWSISSISSTHNPYVDITWDRFFFFIKKMHTLPFPFIEELHDVFCIN